MQPATGSFRIFHIALTNISLGLLGGEKLWAGDVVLAAPLIARQITIQVLSHSLISHRDGKSRVANFSASMLLLIIITF